MKKKYKTWLQACYLIHISTDSADALQPSRALHGQQGERLKYVSTFQAWIMVCLVGAWAMDCKANYDWPISGISHLFSNHNLTLTVIFEGILRYI